MGAGLLQGRRAMVTGASRGLGRAIADRFVEEGAKVLGISSDSVSSHKKFYIKQNLNFPLLSDRKKDAIEAFNVPRKLFGLLPGRVTYIFDHEGKLVHSFDSSVGFEQHMTESIKTIKKLRQVAK